MVKNLPKKENKFYGGIFNQDQKTEEAVERKGLTEKSKIDRLGD